MAHVAVIADDDPKPERKTREGRNGAPAFKLSDDELKQYVEDKLTTAMGAPGSQIALDRLRNIEAYLAEPEGEWSPPEIEDRSAVVATDVADTIEWLLPSLLRVFASNKDAIEATAKRPQFEAGAHMVTETLRWVFWDQLDGVTFLYNWAKDGLMQKVGFARVGYRNSVRATRSRYEGLTMGQVEMLAADDSVQIVGKAQRTETVEGQPLPVFDVEIVQQESDGRCTITAIPPEEMRLDNAARYGQEPQFIAQEYSRRRSELLAEGYDVEGIGADDGLASQERTTRRQINSRQRFDDDDEDPLLRVVDAFVRIGSEDDQSWERVLLIGDRLFDREEVEDHDFVWWCPEPMPHVFFGHCPADRALEPQRLRTRLLRAVEDNVYLTVNGRTGVVEGEVSIDDVLDSRPGGIVRAKSRDSVFPISQPDLSAAAWQVMQWGELWNAKRTGFSDLSKGLNSEALNDTATGVMEITERADMRCELMARHLAQALQRLLTKVMRCMSRYQDVSQAVRIAGQWVDVDPREWANHYTISVRVGLGSGNRDREVAQLTQLMQVQQGLMQAGMVPPPAAITLARKLARAMGQDSPEQLFPDPPPPGPAQPPLPLLIEQEKGRVTIAVEQQRLQADLQKAQATLQLQASNDARDAEREQITANLEAQRASAEQANERLIAQMEAMTQRFGDALAAQTQLQIAAMREQAQAAPQVDVTGIARIESAMQALMHAVLAPKRVVRNPVTHRVEGVVIDTQNGGQ